MNECEYDVDISQHFKWIFNLMSRLIKVGAHSAPLLSLAFIEKNLLTEFDFSILNNIQQNSIPLPIQYAILSSILARKNNLYEIIRHKSDDFFLYEYSISNLLSLGYIPRKPCSSHNLLNNSYIDHVNLCMCFEYVVADKSLAIEEFLDDIRHLPRSFFVLSSCGSRPNSSKQEQRSSDQFFYPTNIEEAVRLWLSKFPCLYELKDLTHKPRVKMSKSCNSSLPAISNSRSINLDSLCNSIELLQNDISNGFHIAAVLARAFPQRINKNEIMQNDSETNWHISKEILEKEVGAFVPSSFPVSDNLFMCFISDLFHATRSGAKKFVRIDNPILNYQNKNLKYSKSNFNTINVYSIDNDINYNNCYNNKNVKNQDKKIIYHRSKVAEKEISNDDENLPNLNQSKNSSIMIRDVNSISASIVFKSTKAKISSLKNKNIHQPSINEIAEEEEFLKLYNILNESSYFFNTELTENSVKSLIHSLVKLFRAKNSSDKTFKRLWRILESKKQSSEQFANGKILIKEISKAVPQSNSVINKFNDNNDGYGFSEIDLRASQNVIAFAKTMISQSIDDNDEFSTYQRVSRIGFSISTQTSSMTHSMSFVRELKSVKVMSTVKLKKSIHNKQKTTLISNAQSQPVETKSIGIQTEFKLNGSNKNNANWKRSSNLVRFETISYPYGESPSGFSRPNSGYSSFRNYTPSICNNHGCCTEKKSSSFAISDENGKKVLIRNINQKI